MKTDPGVLINADIWTTTNRLTRPISFMRWTNANTIFTPVLTIFYEKFLKWFHRSGTEKTNIHDNALIISSPSFKLAFCNVIGKGEDFHQLETSSSPPELIQFGAEGYLPFLHTKAADLDRPDRDKFFDTCCSAGPLPRSPRDLCGRARSERLFLEYIRLWMAILAFKNCDTTTTKTMAEIQHNTRFVSSITSPPNIINYIINFRKR